MTNAYDDQSLQNLKRHTEEMATPWVSEIVLQTSQFNAMKRWYEAILGNDWFVETEPKAAAETDQPREAGDKQARASNLRACFMRLPPAPPYGTVLALFEIKTLGHAPTNDPGLNHMQLKHPDLDALMRRIELLRDHGLHPHRSANHGPMLSFYFRDPDQNVIELCIDNFDTPAEMNAFIQSDKFRSNPSGIEIDRDEFLRRYRAGEAKDTLLAI